MLQETPNHISSPPYSRQVNPKNSYYPTSIPWIKDRASCEEFNRVWENKTCWDGEHDALF
ncbi:MAG: hypothetical protein F6K61_12605 [Sphaerospermopsis sp. SIO1G1]|nr:hypothetical protein [Sphaerospermopsis sp. SIO1G1]